MLLDSMWMSYVTGEGSQHPTTPVSQAGSVLVDGVVGVQSFSGVTLALGRGLRADRCQRTSLTEGDVFDPGVGLYVMGQAGYAKGGLMRDLEAECMGKALG